MPTRLLTINLILLFTVAIVSANGFQIKSSNANGQCEAPCGWSDTCCFMGYTFDNVAGTDILAALQGKCVMITAVSIGVRRKVFRSKYVPEVVSLVQATMNTV